jgi:hypothetical protein
LASIRRSPREAGHRVQVLGDPVGELGAPADPVQLHAVVACVGAAVDAHQALHVGQAAPTHERQQRDPVAERQEGLGHALEQARVLGAGDDRRQRPVDVAEEGRLPEALAQGGQRGLEAAVGDGHGDRP